MGYPILVFHREEATDTPKFIGRYCLNNDKSNAEAFGLKNTGDDGADSKTIKQKLNDDGIPVGKYTLF